MRLRTRWRRALETRLRARSGTALPRRGSDGAWNSELLSRVELAGGGDGVAKAIDLDYSYSQAHRVLGIVLASSGRHNTARTAMSSRAGT